jgi:membrane protein
VKALFHAVVGRFREHELLLRASAIAFQTLTAIVPFGLFLLGAAGFAGLGGVYADDVAPKLQDAVSLPAFSLIDESVRDVLGSKHTFWATAGLALAIWQLSGAVRTVGASLDDIYGIEASRPWRERLLRSLWISAAVAACLSGALLSAGVAPLVYGDVGWLLGLLLWLVRYALAAALLLVAVGIVVRHAPSEQRPARWVTGGALLVTGCWLAVTAGFGAYVTAIASYGSIYGVFVSVVVLLAWTYASALAFVAGIATDAELRDRD